MSWDPPKMVYGAPTAPGRGRDAFTDLAEVLKGKSKNSSESSTPEHHRVTWRGIELTWVGSAFKAELPDGVAVRAIPDGVSWCGQIAIRGGVTSATAPTVIEALDAAVGAWRETLDKLSRGISDPKAPEASC